MYTLILEVRAITGIDEKIPYPAIARAWERGELVPFLGAGASIMSGKSGLKSGPALAEYLAGMVDYPSENEAESGSSAGVRTQTHSYDLANVASFFVDKMGRTPLTSELRHLFNVELSPGPLHRHLAGIDAPQLIVVTNYDNLVEQAFREAGKPFDLVVYPSADLANRGRVLWWQHGTIKPEHIRINKLSIDLTKTNVIYKFHGTVFPESSSWDSFVITEEDYLEYLSMIDNVIPPIFHRHFRDRGFLFMGYGLRDWNLRVLLWNLNRNRSSVQSWAVQKTVSDLDRFLWRQRKVTIFASLIDEFIQTIQKERSDNRVSS